MLLRGVFKFPEHLPTTASNPNTAVKSMGHTGRRAELLFVGLLSAPHCAECGHTETTATRLPTLGCFWLAVETTRCVLTISSCVIEILGEHKRGDYISTGKRNVWGAVARGRCQRRLHRKSGFVTELKSPLYLYLGEALSATESL